MRLWISTILSLQFEFCYSRLTRRSGSPSYFLNNAHAGPAGYSDPGKASAEMAIPLPCRQVSKASK